MGSLGGASRGFSLLQERLDVVCGRLGLTIGAGILRTRVGRSGSWNSIEFSCRGRELTDCVSRVREWRGRSRRAGGRGS